MLLIGGYNPLSSRLTFTGPDHTTPTEDITPFGVTQRTYAPIQLITAKFSHDGLYDDAALASNAELVRMNGAVESAILGLQGNTAGKAFDGYIGQIQNSYKRLATVGKKTRGGADHQVTGNFYNNGLILQPLATLTPPFDSTGIDNGASSANGGVAFFQVTALTLGGYTNLQLKVQHSTNNSTWADLATATVITAAPNAQAIVVAPGTVNRWLRVDAALNGAGSSPSVTVFGGFVRL